MKVPLWRSGALTNLTSQTLDLLVVGGGVVGAGVARDAALRGLLCGLIERADFASGASSGSSRLLHGGLRYLAQGHIGLVREASLEKRRLQRIAPHLAMGLPFVFPTGKSSGWPLWKLQIGVRVYDLLCSGQNFGRSSSLSASQTLDLLPGLQQPGLTGSVRYFDALTNDARLTLDTLRSASTAGAAIINNCPLVSPSREGGIWRCEVRDAFSGHTLSLQARCVVSCAGPWAEGLPGASVRLRLTKGVHLVLDHSRLPVPEAVVLTEGARILFVIPWGRRTILGTTDTDYSGPLDRICVEAEDEDYLLGIANVRFPSARLTPSDILGAWAGVRPLVSDSRGRPSDVSRAHHLHSPQPGWWEVAGGKLTTYRLMAEQAIDQVIRYLNKDAPCRTADLPLVEEPLFSAVLPPPASQEAVQHFCRLEWALHLDDVMLRRTSWQYYEDAVADLASRVSEWMADELGWDAAERLEELRRWEGISAIRTRILRASPSAM